MATISFKEDLYVSSAKKTKEIFEAMKQPKNKSIVSAPPSSLPKNAGNIWFKQCH